MRHSLSPLLLLLLFFFFFLQAISSSPIEDICENVQDSYVDKDFCIRTLKSDVRSHKADAKGLAVIAAELSLAKATAIRSHTEQLVKSARTHYARRRAEAALLLFSNVIPSLRWSAVSIASKFYASAGAVLFVALDAATACVGVVELGDAADDYVNLTLLAQAIAVHLH
ncbi:hypothetical protein Cni_G25470 [Canna indica]|uniref:Pectinesterase inhibitor domain-containing protein n=1 Tax=Canna indica TaxID=4628 RepID=A0AAQ3L4E2_9LILI|nr:hypothetical protein Cni_G25470 [Canna indica]